MEMGEPGAGRVAWRSVDQPAGRYTETDREETTRHGDDQRAAISGIPGPGPAGGRIAAPAPGHPAWAEGRVGAGARDRPDDGGRRRRGLGPCLAPPGRGRPWQCRLLVPPRREADGE